MATPANAKPDPPARFLANKRAALGKVSHAAADFLADTRNIARDGANLVRQLTASPRIGRDVAVYLGVAAAVLLIGALLFSLTAIQFLLWAAPGQPAWAAYGEVTLVVTLIGIVLGLVGRRRMHNFDPLKQQSLDLMQDVAAAAEHASDTVDAARETIHRTAK